MIKRHSKGPIALFMTNAAGSLVSKKSQKFYGLDHLRAFAIIAVFVFHYGRLFPHPDWIFMPGKFGWTGVDLFFVLSGYLIASQLFREIEKRKAIDLKAFFLKRFLRIAPAYFVVVVLYFCFPFIREREGLAPLWKYLTFTQNFGLDLRTQGTFSQAWSLCIEEQFYLLLPVILLLLLYFKAMRSGKWLLIILFLSGFAIRLFAYRNYVEPFIDEDDFGFRWIKAIYYPTYCRLDGLLAGVCVAAMVQYYEMFTKRLLRYGNLLFLISICILSGAYFICLNEKSLAASVAGFPLVSIGYGIMVLSAISPACCLYKINSRFTTAIASWSYSLYLTHKFIIHLTQAGLSKVNIADNSNGMLAGCMLSCLFGAYIVYQVIEKPFQRLRDHLLRLNINFSL